MCRQNIVSIRLSLARRSTGQPVINVLYQNVRGLRTKTKACFLSVECDSYDVYCLTETWTNDSIQNAELFPGSYIVVRNDNMPSLSGKTCGGGVLIALKDCFALLKEPVHYNTSLTDAIFVYTSMYNAKALLCCVYIWSGSPAAEYYNFFDYCSSLLDSLDPNVKVFFFGDFNLPTFVSERNVPKPSQSVAYLINFAGGHELLQYNECVNTNRRLLDLILSNTTVDVIESPSYFVKTDNHHPPLLCTLRLNLKTDRNCGRPVTSRRYDFSKGNLMVLYNQLANLNINFSSVWDANQACNVFYSSIYEILDGCIHKKSSLSNPKYPPYFTTRIISRLKYKNKILKKLKKSSRPSSDIVGKYKHLRKSIKIDIKKAYSKYVEICENTIIKDPKKIWGFTCSKLDRKHSMPQSLYFDDELISEPQSIADKFSCMFNALYSQDQECFSVVDAALNVKFTANNNVFSKTTEGEVKDAIKKLKPSTSCGPDGIPQVFLKAYGDLLAKPLSHLFNICLQQAVYPAQWKISRVCPIFKKGDKNKGENYRPVSIINAFSKCFEMLLADRMFVFVKCIIAPEQHGFIKGRSTTTNLVTFTSSVSDSLAKKLQVDSVYLDFRSAFDKVSHSILLLKLCEMPIPPYLLFVLKSFLFERQQFVAINGARSELMPVTSGVPQGSNLGPLLFCLFVNDLPRILTHTKVLLYADDLKIFREIHDADDCEKVQEDIDSICEWASMNGMMLHSGKCEVVRFGRGNKIVHNYIVNGETLKSSSTIKDLGVWFSDNLSFKAHISNIVISAKRILSFVIRMCHNFRSLSTFKLLFYSLVRSRLEYCSVVWNPAYDYQISDIEKLQKRFLRYMYFREHKVYPHYRIHPVRSCELLREFNLQSLVKRRDLLDCLFMYHVVNNNIDCAEILEQLSFRVNVRSTRSRNLFVDYSHTANPVKRIMTKFNGLDCDPFYECPVTFKKSVILALNNRA